MTVFAACSKNEVAPVNDGSNAISYITVANKPGTKAPIAGNTFAEDLVFGSYAFHLPSGKTWADNKSDAELYINNETIKYYPAASGSYAEDSWHAANAYYWPKDGKLTFYSYSFGKDNMNHEGVVSCTKADGLKVTGYDVTGTNNLNSDFMVANIQRDQQKIAGSAGTTSAVPTLFKHVLTQIVGINVYTNGPTPVGGTPQAGDKEITIKSIKLYGLSQEGDFSYDYDFAAGGNDANYYGEWTNLSATKTSRTSDFNLFTATAPTISGTRKLFTTEQKLFIPQDLTGAEIEIVYDIKSYSSASEGATQEITQTLNLTTAQNTTGANPRRFDANKAITYTILINFGADDLIYWDPSVDSWEQESYSFTI